MSSNNIFDIKYINLLKLGPKNIFLAACDEVGRGPIAGPVVAATVFMNMSKKASIKEVEEILQNLKQLGVTDSKKLTSKKRKTILKKINIDYKELASMELFGMYKSEDISIDYLIAEISHKQIDQINILNATLKAMKESFEICLGNAMRSGPSYGILLIDGIHTPTIISEQVKAIPVAKGDSKSILIALSSIIAKEYRDNYMEKMNLLYPGYGFDRHAGYPTVQHKKAVQSLGVSPIHRRSFKGVKEYL